MDIPYDNDYDIDIEKIRLAGPAIIPNVKNSTNMARPGVEMAPINATKDKAIKRKKVSKASTR